MAINNEEAVTPEIPLGDSSRILAQAATSTSNRLLMQAATASNRLTVIVRNRLLTNEMIAGASVTLTDTISGVTNNNGRVTLTVPADGSYTINVDPPAVSSDPVGPAIASTGNPPDRIFRALYITLTIRNGQITEAVELNPGSVAFGPSQITVGLQPVWIRSPNTSGQRPANSQITLIVIHHTGGTAMPPPNFIQTGGESPHYVIATDGQIVKMVRDNHVAFHAGDSQWHGLPPLPPNGLPSVNRSSIGIEIVNQTGQAYKAVQYEALITLLNNLLTAYPTIPRYEIVGHSDVALNPSGRLGRKSSDPGQHFEWERLEQRGLGLGIVNVSLPETIFGGFFTNYANERLGSNDDDIQHRYGGRQRPDIPISGSSAPIREVQDDLFAIGYSIDINGTYDLKTEWAVHMFQEHFFSGNRFRVADGRLDRTTAITIKSVRTSFP